MTLVKFGNSLKNNSQEQDSFAIGIDLGTTNSLIAYYNATGNSSFVKVLGSSLVPSCVYYGKSNIKVGKEALNVNDNKNTIFSIKRILGKSLTEAKSILPFLNYNEDSSVLSFNVNGRKLTPVDVARDILAFLKKQAEQEIGSTINKAVITVPAYFDDNARSLTKQAANLAGLEVLRLINEPTAAALAYGLDENMKGSYVVYDFGGGTFDCTILSMRKGIFKVLATAGDTTLGGGDIDNALIDFIINNKIIPLLKANIKLSHDLHTYLCSKVSFLKENIYKQKEITLNLNINKQDISININVNEFEKVISTILNKTYKIINSAIQDSKVANSEINGFILVGGSSKLESIKNHIKENYCKNIYDNLNAQESVALGAMHQAATLLKLKKGNLLLDVVPLSLGIELAGGVVEKIIPRNSSTPVKKAQVFTTYKDGQTKLKIHVLQGERELVKDCRSLAKFTLSGIPKMVASMPRIEVTFQVDADGLLTVSAKELSIGKEQKVEVKPTWGVSLEEMKKMVFDSLANGAKDMQERLLILAKVEARRVLDATYNALKIDSHLITKEQVKNIKNACLKLENLITLENKENIDSSLEELAKLTTELAEKRMNNAIAEEIKGKNVDDIAK